jgi:hypothetical protein
MMHKRPFLAAVSALCLLPGLALAGAGQPLTSQNISTTIAAGGSFQNLAGAGANPSRNGCLIQNPTTATEPLYVHFGSDSATAANSYSLAPGASISCGVPGGVITDTIQVEATTTAHAFIAEIQ